MWQCIAVRAPALNAIVIMTARHVVDQQRELDM